MSVGTSQKVSAIDPVTGIEVSVTGPLNAPRDQISQIAVSKLKRRIEQEQNQQSATDRPQKGIIL